MPGSVTIIDNDGVHGRRSQIQNLASNLKRDDIEVTLVGSKSDADITIPLKTGTDIEFLIRLSFYAIFNRIPKTDVIHSWRIVALFPFILSRHKSDLVATCAGEITVEMKENQPRTLVTIYNIIERITVKNIDSIIAVNDGTKKYLNDKYPDIYTDIYVIPVGIERSVFHPMNNDSLSEFGIPDRYDDIIGYVGRLTIIKNIPLLLQAFTKIQNTREIALIIVGEGDMLQSIKNTTEKLGIEDDVFFLNRVDHNKIPIVMNIIDCLVLTSKTEGSPNVVREALCCGTPIVSTPVGDVPELLDNSNAGIIVDSNPSSVSNGITEILENHSAYAQATYSIASKLSYNKSYQDIINVYDS